MLQEVEGAYRGREGEVASLFVVQHEVEEVQVELREDLLQEAEGHEVDSSTPATLSKVVDLKTFTLIPNRAI